MIRIGNAQAFWGDNPHAPAQLIHQQSDLDYLTLDYLSEVSMSIMAIQREKDPSGGYAKDFLDVIRSLVPFWKAGNPFKVITNAGGLNPQGCAEECQKILSMENLKLTIGIVTGDDIFYFLKANSNPNSYLNLDTQEPLSLVQDRLVTANAYLGAQKIAEALNAGADIVITGRVADPSLTVAPCIAHYGWKETEYHKVAGATIAGHLIECGTQVTGGIFTRWLEVPDRAHIGFPFVEINEDGSFIITKPEISGGMVTIETVKEQLLYEIGNPSSYLSPDVTVSFLSLALKEMGPNRIRVSGAIGKPPPTTYKVSATYRAGYKTEGLLAVMGPEASKKARACGEVLLQRMHDLGYNFDRTLIEAIGDGAIVPGITHQQHSLSECLLRIAIADLRYEALECFSKEIASLVTSGPQGITGYTTGRPHIRPIFGYWPCLIPCSQVKPHFQILESI